MEKYENLLAKTENQEKDFVKIFLTFPQELYDNAKIINKELSHIELDVYTLPEDNESAVEHNESIYNIEASLRLAERQNIDTFANIKSGFIKTVCHVKRYFAEAHYPSIKEMEPWKKFFEEQGDLISYFNFMIFFINNNNKKEWVEYLKENSDLIRGNDTLWKVFFKNESIHAFTDSLIHYFISEFEMYCDSLNQYDLKEEVLSEYFWNAYKTKEILSVSENYIYNNYSIKLDWLTMLNKFLSIQYKNIIRNNTPNGENISDSVFSFFVRNKNKEFLNWLIENECQIKPNEGVSPWLTVSDKEIYSLKTLAERRELLPQNFIDLTRFQPALQSEIKSYFDNIVLKEKINKNYEKNQMKRI